MGEFVAALAMRLVAVVVIASTDVLTNGDGLQVVRIHTGMNAAEMVYDHARRDRAAMQLVTDPVSGSELAVAHQ